MAHYPKIPKLALNEVPAHLRDKPSVPVAYGSRDNQRLYWEEIIQAGQNRKLMDLVLPDYADTVFQYQVEANSTETAEIRFAQHSPHGVIPCDIRVGPNGGGRLRVAGSVRVNIQVENEVAGSCRIRVWAYPDGYIGTLPPVSTFGVTLASGLGGTPGPWVAVSPTQAPIPATGWCPWGRTRVSIGADAPVDVSFQDQGPNVIAQYGFNPLLDNTSLELTHPPQLRMFVRNRGTIPHCRLVATWEDQ